MIRTSYASRRIDRTLGRRLGVGGLLVVFLACGAALTGGGAADAVRDRPGATRTARATTAVGHERTHRQRAAHGARDVDAAQARAFGILRDVPDATTALSAAVSRVIRRDGSGNLHGARRAGATPDGQALYVVPGRGRLCVASGDGLLSCGRTADAVAGRLVVAQRRRQGVLLVGVMPDGVASVEIAGPAGTAEAEVRHNAWSAVVSFEPTSVGWARGKRRAELAVRMPPGEADPSAPAPDGEG